MYLCLAGQKHLHCCKFLGKYMRDNKKVWLKPGAQVEMHFDVTTIPKVGQSLLKDLTCSMGLKLERQTDCQYNPNNSVDKCPATPFVLISHKKVLL